MKKIGLYFGSFNPVHIGHMIIANHIVNHYNKKPQDLKKSCGFLVNSDSLF